MKKQRIVTLDLIRLIAILLVIMQHTWTGLQLNDPSVGIGCHFYNALVVIGVPLFFMLSGALMLDVSPPPPAISDFLKKRFKRLLIPFFLWGTIVYVLSVIMHKYPNIVTFMDALHHYIPYMLSDKVNASYWYIFVLIGLYLLTPFLQRALLVPQSKRLVQYGLLLWSVWMVLRTYYPQFGSMHYYSGSAFMYMGFFLCGHYCVKYLTDNRMNMLVGILGFCVSYALNVWGLAFGVNISVVHTVAVISLFLLLKSCIIPRRAAGLVTSAGRYTYVIYFVHVLVVAALCMLDIWVWCPLWIRPLVITLLSFVISYFVAYILDHMRFVPNAWVGI